MTQADQTIAEEESPFTWVHWGVVMLIAVCILVAVITTPAVVQFVTGKKPATAGEFGDMFGAVNAIFSGLAFLGVVVAILLQRQELVLQRKELADTREVLEQQRNEMQSQNASFRKQQFESMFFQMISLHNQIVNDLDTKKSTSMYKRIGQRRFAKLNGIIEPSEPTEEIVRGRDVFEVFYQELKKLVASKKPSQSPEEQKIKSQEEFASIYEIFREKKSADLDHYFRNLYTIMKFADEHGGDTAQSYVNILRAQLSAFELILLFYNCTCGPNIQPFRSHVEKYGFFEHLQFKLLINGTSTSWISHDALYEKVTHC
ncbi:putative phage abortive infection protein [Novipirellula sp. SH528]|uniref:putative phage abortive infection protein n=1 Tax=Novipirellula sp. SH528 TaxID=3454466 RepID=UPI003F9EF166